MRQPICGGGGEGCERRVRITRLSTSNCTCDTSSFLLTLTCIPPPPAFLSGRYPAHISGQQAPAQSNFLPLQFSTLGEKLAAAGYESFFVGKVTS